MSSLSREIPIRRQFRSVQRPGVGNSGGQLGFLAGVCEPFDAATLDRLYTGGKSTYLKRFEASLASAIKAGFILPADRQEILSLAAIAYRGSH